MEQGDKNKKWELNFKKRELNYKNQDDTLNKWLNEI